jgi:subtilisin family serine protease
LFSLLSAAWLCSAAATAQDFQAEFTRPEPKISFEIEQHRELKRQPPTRTLDEHRLAVRGLRLDEDDLDREEVAIYVDERFGDADVEAYRSFGVEIHPLFVPAVPGRHPYGFHMAEVPYEFVTLLAQDPRVVHVRSMELRYERTNDEAIDFSGIDHIHSGLATGQPRDGTGVLIAIADSGFDLTHPDLPLPQEAFDMTDGTTTATWGNNVANLVSGHGTHVAGTAVGRGTASGGLYTGAAPGANWLAYKIGNDCSSGASGNDMIEAIVRAASQNADIFQMSYGGFGGGFLDGSGMVEQAIDLATLQGVVSVIAAGNSTDDELHIDRFIAPSASAAITLRVTNTNNVAAIGIITTNFIWRDNSTNDANITASCTSFLGPGESFFTSGAAISSRGTEQRLGTLNWSLPANTQKQYTISLSNGASGQNSTRVHAYVTSFDVNVPATFVGSTATHLVGNPAVADTAIAVGAWVHREDWVNSVGDVWDFGQTFDTLASFSSVGPRIDGVIKPEIVAPGSAMISLRDSGSAFGGGFTCPTCTTPPANCGQGFPNTRFIIDNDGDTSGAAQYYVMQGTSMAAPFVSGMLALLLEEDPSLSPAEVRSRLTATASLGLVGGASAALGFGQVGAIDLLQSAQLGIHWVDFASSGIPSGTWGAPWSNLAQAVQSSTPGTTIRIKAGQTTETAVITSSRLLESAYGSATIGEAP